MKKLQPSKAWILLCSIILVSYATAEHCPYRHDGLPHHGANRPRKQHQKMIVPIGIQMPEHVLSTQEVACISADKNIFEIMNKAQEYCAGKDMRCTFYYFSNHGYQNIGTLDIDKKLFNALLMKYDNLLVTAENIVNTVPYLSGHKTRADNSNSFDKGRMNVNDVYNKEHLIDISSHQTNRGLHIGKFDHNTKESDDDKVNHIKIHHVKTPPEIHYQNHNDGDNDARLSNFHGNIWKNKNYMQLNPEYNNDRKYFEVFLPRDKNKGQPRTIYVKIDDRKNELVLFDEEIDEELNSGKPIKIELDELSEIADVAFNNIAKSSIDNQNILKDHSNTDERVMISDINTNSAIHEDNTNLYVEEAAQNILQSSELNSNICNLNTNEKIISDLTNVNKNMVTPNKSTNQAQFFEKSQLDIKTAKDISINDLKLSQSSNMETDIDQIGINDEVTLNTSEYSNYNTDTKLDVDDTEFSSSKNILNNENNNNISLENYEFSRESENVDFDDNSNIKLVENNNFSSDFDFDNTNDFSSTRLSKTLHLNEPVFQVEKPYQENKLKSTPYIFTLPKISSYPIAKISDYTGSIPSQNQLEHPVRQDLSSMISMPLSPYITVPLLGKKLAKELETDSQLQSSFPMYATLGASQNILLNPGSEYPSASNICQYASPILPSPLIESVVRLDKGTKYIPLNGGLLPPSYSRVQELQLPCSESPTPLDHAFSLQESMLASPLPNKEFSSSLASIPLDHAVPVQDPGLFQSVPSLSLILPLEATISMAPEHILTTSKLYFLPKSDTNFDTFPSNFLSTPIFPLGSKDAASIPCPVQQTPHYLPSSQANKSKLMDSSSGETIPIYIQNDRINPWSTNRFRNPYNTIPQHIPPCLERLLPLKPIPKMVTLNPSQLSLDKTNQYLNGDYPREIEPISYMPIISKTPISPLTRLLKPNISLNTLTCPNVMNKIPYHNIPSLSCTALPGKSISNHPLTVANDLTPDTRVQQDQILKQVIKDFPLSIVEQPYSVNNILEIIPLSHKPLLPVQVDLKPCLDVTLDRNLPILLSQPIIQNPNIVDKEFSDAHSKIVSSAPLYLTPQNPYTDLVFDSSLIGSHLPTLSTTKPCIDEKQYMNAELFLEPDLTDLTPLDSFLIGAHLDNENPPLTLNFNNVHNKTSLPHPDVPITSSTQVETQLSIESQATNLLLENSPYLTTLSPINPSLSDEVQSVDEVLPLDSDINNLMALDSSYIDTEVDFESQLKQLEILQKENPAITLSAAIPNPKPIESVPSNLIIEDLPLESNFSNLEHLDTSRIDPRLETGSSPIIIDSVEHKTVPAIPLDSFQNIGDKIADLESNILPPSLDILLNSDLNLNTISQNTQLNNELSELPIYTIDFHPKLSQPIKNVPELIQSTQFCEEVEPISDISTVTPLTIDSSIPHSPFLHTDLKIIEPKDSKVSQQTIKPLDMSPASNSENKLNSSLIGPSLLQEKEITEKPVLDIKIQIDNSLYSNNIELIETPIVDAKSQLDSSLIGPTLQREINPLEIAILDSEIQLNKTLTGSTLHQEVKPLETLTILDSDTQLDSTLIGSGLNQETESKEVSSVLESSSQLDNSLTGPNLSTVTLLLNDKINEELQPVSDLTNLIPLDSSVIDINTQADFLSQLKQSKIPRYEKPTLSSSLSPTNLNCYETTEFLPSNLIGEQLRPASTSSKIELLPSNLVGEGLPLESSVSSICTSDLQKLSPIVMNPQSSADLLVSIAEISSDNIYPKLPSTDLQMLTLNTLLNTPTSLVDDVASDFSSLPVLTLPAQKISPEIIIKNEHPCLESNIISESLSYPNAPFDFKTVTSNLLPFKGLPLSTVNFQPIDILYSDHSDVINKDFYNNVPFGLQIPVSSYSPFVKIKPLMNRDWQVPQSLNIQNILQASPGLKPALNAVANVPLISSPILPLPSEFSKPFLDVTSYSKPSPQIPEAIPEVATISPSPLELTTPSLNKYIPLLPNKTPSVFPSNSQSTICDSKYSSTLLDDNFPVLDDNAFQLLKDMSILPLGQPSITSPIVANEKGFPGTETVSQPGMAPSLLYTTPVLNTGFITTRPVLSIPITNPIDPLSIYSNPENVPIMVQRPNITPCNLEPYSNVPLDAKFHETIRPIPQYIQDSNVPEIASIPVTFFDNPKMTLPCFLPLPQPVLEDDTALLPPLSINTLENAGYPKYIPEIITKPYSVIPQYKTLKSPPYSTPLLTMNSLIPQKTLDLSSVYYKPTESQLHDLPNIPQPIELGTNPIPDSEFLQQVLSKPCLESLDTNAQLPTTANESYYSTILVPNAFTNPILPTYSSPLSLGYTKPISNTILLSPVHPYSDSPASFTSPLPVKMTQLSGYPYPPTVVQTIPITSAVPSKPSQTFSSPYIPIHPKLLPIYTRPSSPNFISKLTEPLTKPESLVYSDHISTPCLSPVPKEITNSGSIVYSGLLPSIFNKPIAPMRADLLSPSSVRPVSSTYSPSSLLSPTYINPVLNHASHLPCNMPLPSSSSRPLIGLKSQVANPQIQIQRPLKTLPVSYAISPFLKANQRLSMTPSKLPIQSYPTPAYSPISSSDSNSKTNDLQKKIPCEEALESNLQALPLTEEASLYDNREENICSYSNDIGDKFYKTPSIKYPSESFLYTLVPKEITEALPVKDFTKQDLILSSPVNNLATGPALHSNLYQRPHLAPYTRYYSKPCLAPTLPLPFTSFIETESPILLENIQRTPSFSTPFSVPPRILSSPLLNPLSPVSPTLVSPNSLFPLIPDIPLSLSPSSSISPFSDNGVSPYNILPMDEKPQYRPLLSSPYYSAPSQEISTTSITPPLVKCAPRLVSSPIDSSRLGNILSSQGTSYLTRVPTISQSIAVPYTSQNIPAVPNIPENYILLPPISTKPKPNTPPYQGSLALQEPSPLSSYNQYVEPIISYNTPAKDITFPENVIKIQTPISLQYLTPLSSALKPIKPISYLQYISSILPTQATLQDNLPVNESPPHYQRFAPLPTGLTSNNANNYKRPPVALPYTVSASSNNIDTTNDFVSPINTIFNSPPLSSFTPQYSLPSPKATDLLTLLPTSFSSPESISPFTNQASADNILPSPMVTDFQMPLNKLSSLHNNPKYSLSSLALTKPLGTVPYYTASRPLEQMSLLQNILKPNTQFSNGQAPLSSSASLTQPLKSTDSYQSKTSSHFQYITQPHPKLSPGTGEYIPPYLSPSHTSLPLDTVTNILLNKPSLPKYSSPVYDTPIHSSPLARNSFINSDFKTIPEVTSSPISSPKTKPSDSIILSNLLVPLDTSQDPVKSYSSPITSSTPLYSSSLLKPLVKSALLQKSTHPQLVPIITQYAESASQLLPSPGPLLRSSLLKPLITNTQNNDPLLPIHRSSLNTAFPKMTPSKYLPSISNNMETFGPLGSLISELPEPIEPINIFPTTPYSLLKSPFINYIEPQYVPVGSLPSLQNSPINSIPLLEATESSLSSADTKSYASPITQYLPTTTKPLSATVLSPSNRLNTAKPLTPNDPRYGHLPSQILTSVSQPQHEILEASSNLPIKASIIKATRPKGIKAKPTSDSLDIDMIELTEPCAIIPESKDRFLPLPLDYSQQRQYYPIFSPDYVPLSKLTQTALPLQNKIAQTSSTVPSLSSLLSDETEIVGNTDFINSPIDTEPLIPIPSINIKAPVLTNTPSIIPLKQSVSYPELLQLPPYSTLLNIDYPHKSTVNQYLSPCNNNQIPQPSPIYLSPLENRDFPKGPSSSHASLSSNFLMSPLTSTNIGSQVALGQLTGESSPVFPNPDLAPLALPHRTIPQLLKSQIPIFAKSLPNHEKLIEVTPEKESLQTVLNKYRPANIRPIQIDRAYELKSSISEGPLELDSPMPSAPVKPEPITKYEEDIESIKITDNDSEITPCVLESEKNSLDETKLNVLCLPEICKGLSVPIYNKIEQRPQRFSKLENFYANNHIEASPQILNVPIYNKIPIDSYTNVKKPSNTVSPMSSKDFTTEPSIHFGSFSKLDTRIPKILTELPLVTKLFPKNFLNPCLELSPQMKFSPNTVELPTVEHAPYDNTEDIKYMGYKTSQIPTFKPPQIPQNRETLPHVYPPSSLLNEARSIPIANRPNIQQITTPSNIYIPTEIPGHLIHQYQNPVKITSPLQTKLGLNTFQQSPKSNEYYNLVEDVPICIDNINEDNELKTTLVNYINRKGVKNNLYNNNAEVTIPIGNIAITKNGPCNADTIETNNPSIRLKVWKSNVKIVQAELKLKLKELSVNNFMPIVNNLNKYDVEEIRKIIKNYIDEKYGNHLEVNEPYTIDNKYTVIKDFGHNAVDNFNLLWPTNNVHNYV